MFCGIGYCGSVTDRQIVVTGSGNRVECLSETESVTLSGTSNECKVNFGYPIGQLSGHGNRLITLCPVHELAIAGNANIANIGMDAGNVALYGSGHQVIVAGNAGHVFLLGDSSNVTIEGSVDSLTIGGSVNLIHIRGHCFGDIKIRDSKSPEAERTFPPPQIQRNLVYVAGTAQTLDIDSNGYRNKIQCGRIENVHMDGNENRVESCYGMSVDSGTGNLIDDKLDMDAPYSATPDSGDTNASDNDCNEQQQHINEEPEQFNEESKPFEFIQDYSHFNLNREDYCYVQ